MTRTRLTLLSLVALLCCLSLAGGARAATINGIADEDLDQWSPATWSAFKATGVGQVRHIVRWDTAWVPKDLQEAHDWVNKAQEEHIPIADILISFGVNWETAPPSAAIYESAVRAFREQFPGIRYYTAWNEPNHHLTNDAGVQLNPVGNPARAAEYWLKLNSLCGGGASCTVVGGDFADSDSASGFTSTYLAPYKERLAAGGAMPSIWAIHPYRAIRTGDWSMVNNGFVANTENKPIWFTEVGGMYCFGGSTGGLNGDPGSVEANQRAAVANLRALMDSIGPRLQRTYYYALSAPNGGQHYCVRDSKGNFPFDSTLLGAGDTPRAAFSMAFPGALNPPSVQTWGQTNVTRDRATANANISPNFFRTSYFFDYGRTTAYGGRTPTEDAGFAGGASPRSATISGLQPGTTYHYRVVAFNAAGVSYGADQTFRTPDFDVRSSGVLSEGAGGVQWVYYAKDNSPVAQFFGSGSTFYNPVLNGMIQSGPLGPPARAGSVPASLREPASGEHWVYYVSSSNTIWTYWWSGTQWLAGELGGNVRPGTNVVAVRNPRDASQSVFYVNASGQIAQFYWSAAGGWKSRVLGGSVQAGSSPAAVLDPGNGIQWVYYVNSSGQIAQFYGWDDTYYPGLIGGSAAPGTSPAVIMDPENAQHWVYYVKSTGNLGEFWWNGVNAWAPEDIGLPVRAGTSPTVVRDSATTQQWVYYVKPNLELGEAWWNSQYWQSREVGGFAMAGASPSAVRDPASGYQWVSVRSSEKDTRLMEWNQSSWVPRLLQGS